MFGVGLWRARPLFMRPRRAIRMARPEPIPPIGSRNKKYEIVMVSVRPLRRDPDWNHLRHGWLDEEGGGFVKTSRQFTIGEMLLLVLFIGIWLTVTIQLSSLSVFFWGLAMGMAAVLRPSHQRRPTPVTVTDVVSIAVGWGVACGILGFLLDMRIGRDFAPGAFSWTLFGELTGFYLGLMWVMVVFLFRHVERVVGAVNRPRPIT